MARWIHTPLLEPPKYHPYQAEFWEAHKSRLCTTCKGADGEPLKFQVSPESWTCPNCDKLGLREWHRLLMLSGRRGGKTFAGAIAAVTEACIPNTMGWCCAPTDPKLNRYILPALQRLIPNEWVRDYSAEYNDIYLKNGSVIHLQTLEKPDQGRGQGLHWLWLDEACELTRQHWDVIRPSLTEHRGVAFITTSPRSYDWVYEDFFRRAEEGFPGYWAARYATVENPIISKEEVAEARETMSDLMFRQEYEADFVTFTGSIYGDYMKESCILRNKEQVKRIIPEWPDISRYTAIIGLDSGADHPFGALMLVSTEQGMVVVGEYLERNKSFHEHAVLLRRMGSRNTRWAINKNEKQAMIELAQHGILCQPAQNDQIAGIERVRTWLEKGQLFFIEELCPTAVRQMRSYRWAENVSPKDESKRRERVYKKDDELPDCLRYALMTWPSLPVAAPPDPNPKRDLSQVPAATRQVIERMRRIEQMPSEEPSVVGDFYL